MKELKLNNNHYQQGFVIGSSNDMSVELVLLHVKKVGGVLKE